MLPLLAWASQDYDSREDIEKSGKAAETEVAEASATFWDLLIPQVVLPLVVFMVQAVIDMSVKVLLPLMYSTSIELGGLGFDAYHIGVIMSVWGVINAIFTIMVFGRAIRKFGSRTVHIFCYVTYFVNIALYPLLVHFVQRSGRVDAKVWAVIVLQLACQLGNGVSYGVFFFFLWTWNEVRLMDYVRLYADNNCE